MTATIVKTLTLKPYKGTFDDIIKLGNYNYVDQEAKDFVFGSIDLPESKIDLVQFNEEIEADEFIDWGKKNRKTPISVEQLLAIGYQYPEEQRNNPIVCLGSVRSGRVLFLGGGSGWRGLGRRTVAGRWVRDCLFGFVSESVKNLDTRELGTSEESESEAKTIYISGPPVEHSEEQNIYCDCPKCPNCHKIIK